MRILLPLIATLLFFDTLKASDSPWSVGMADAFIQRYPDSILIGDADRTNWNYEMGLMMEAISRVWERTGEGKYFYYIQRIMDNFVQEDGGIRTYDIEDYNIDMIAPGRALLLLYQETGKEKYRKAADLLRRQLAEHPRTKENGFWHKKRYPYQMWLDGLYMAEPFYAEYSMMFDDPESLDDVARQFELVEKYCLDEKTGLLHHGYDESRRQKWADPKTGLSSNIWGRSIGWYAMALVDVLDYLPTEHKAHAKLVSYLQRLAPVLLKYQDESGCWWQMTTEGDREGNYLEASATAMKVYTLLKGARLGYLSDSYRQAAEKGYQCMLDRFVQRDPDGSLHFEKTVSVGGLGGRPYRDGSYEYYLSEPIRRDDLKGVGPFIKASVEMEILEELAVGQGKTVGLDYYFNNEYRTDKDGSTERFHYTWEDRANSGFWLWGQNFQHYGADITSLAEAPTAANLKGLDVYIIVDPDTPKETAAPNYMEAKHVKAIKQWVKKGGVLVLMANDAGNAELEHFNQLATAFGIRFTDKSRNMVQGRQFEQGLVVTPANHPIFGSEPLNLYLKEISVLEVKSPAKAVLQTEGDNVIAVAEYGKGAVFAVGDPWLYNEYTNGKKLPADFDNFAAGKALAAWLLGR